MLQQKHNNKITFFKQSTSHSHPFSPIFSLNVQNSYMLSLFYQVQLQIQIDRVDHIEKKNKIKSKCIYNIFFFKQ